MTANWYLKDLSLPLNRTFQGTKLCTVETYRLLLMCQTTSVKPGESADGPLVFFFTDVNVEWIAMLLALVKIHIS